MQEMAGGLLFDGMFVALIGQPMTKSLYLGPFDKVKALAQL